MEIGNDTLCHHLTDTFHLLQFLQSGIHQCIHRLEVACQQTSRGLTYKTDTQGEDNALEGHFLRFLYTVDDTLGRFRTRAVTINLLYLDIIQVSNVMDNPALIVFIHGLRTKRIDIHRLTGNEMFDASLNLWRTTGIVGTIPCSLALIAHQRCATFRTALDELYGLRDDRTLINVHTHNLGDNLTTLFHIDHITDVEVETTDKILVIQRCTLHDSTCQLYRFHVGNRRHRASTTYLVSHFQQTRAFTLSLEFIGDCPARALGCIS